MATFKPGDWVEVSTSIPKGDYGHGIAKGIILRVGHVHIDNQNHFLFLINPPHGYEARTDTWPCNLGGIAFTVTRWWPVRDSFCRKVDPPKVQLPNEATQLDKSYREKQEQLWRKKMGLDGE